MSRIKVRLPKETVRCAVCGHVGPGYVPKGGDGSLLYPYPHTNKGRGVYAERCHGDHVEAIIVGEPSHHD